jgi:DNA-binding PadR family transcriptional regulator
MWNRDCGPRDRDRSGRGWEWKGEAGTGPFWFGFGPRRGGPRGGRMFEQGDLKFVILQLLAEKPRHGYEIIKELEERSGGRYSPSPGTVYPTLTLLEDMGYAVATAEESGKKVYAITDAGRAYLAENRSTADEVLERISQVGASLFGEQMRPAHEAMAALGKSYLHLTMHRAPDTALVDGAVAILRKAAADLDELVSRK